MEKLNKITIGEKQYPVKIDINVLETIQNEYGSVYAFERDILGLKFIKDEEGQQIYDEKGSPKAVVVEPSVKAVKFILPLMINEGLQIEAEETGGLFEPVEETQIYRGRMMELSELASFIHAEYKRCYAAKKTGPGKRMTPKSR